METKKQVMSREEAIKILKRYWGTDVFIFQADFHIPKGIKLIEETRPFGYFRNFRLQGEIIDYPLKSEASHDRRIGIKYNLRKGLEDNQTYEVEVELSDDNYRQRNPFSLKVKHFRKITSPPNQSTQESGLGKHIREIFEENLKIDSPFQVVNLANSVESLATDIYSENKRFIYELIQNADDAAMSEDAELSIDILEDYVVISHNGAPFDARDIRGLCSIGISNRRDDASKTGYKGIGFKSVFGQPDGIVYVKSQDTLFRFDRDYASKIAWNPTWGDKENWENKHRIEFLRPWQMMPILSDKTDSPEADILLSNSPYASMS